MTAPRQNRQAIGARVEIRAPDGRLQVRDIKGSGGYSSFDAPVAFFGLGDWPSVASVSVTWPDGTVSGLRNLALASGRYTLTRRPPEKDVTSPPEQKPLSPK